jgi:hypothetical protein
VHFSFDAVSTLATEQQLTVRARDDAGREQDVDLPAMTAAQRSVSLSSLRDLLLPQWRKDVSEFLVVVAYFAACGAGLGVFFLVIGTVGDFLKGKKPSLEFVGSMLKVSYSLGTIFVILASFVGMVSVLVGTKHWAVVLVAVAVSVLLLVVPKALGRALVR